jgi:hypothetical protein
MIARIQDLALASRLPEALHIGNFGPAGIEFDLIAIR